MPSVCFYFQVHQPYRMRRYNILDVGHRNNYFDAKKNYEVCRKVADKCYIPMNTLLLEEIARHKGKFKVAFSITGVALDQFAEYTPEVIDLFKKLAATGCVEFLSETYFHSLSFLYSKNEFLEQVDMHRKKIKELFNYEPKVFRNTELIYNNYLATTIESMGYEGIVAEGADSVLGWRSPNFLYQPKNTSQIKLLLKNYKLSDDIAFRFSNKGWAGFPLYAQTYANWISSVNGNGNVVNLFMDYETFGEHQWADTGIFDFMHALPGEILKNPDNDFITPTEAVRRYRTFGELDIHHPISWADTERDLSAWLSNAMQHNAINQCYRLEQIIKNSGNQELIHEWRKMTTSDHYYYMCTKYFNDGDVHKYFSPYNTPYEAFINFMNIMEDIKNRAQKPTLSFIHHTQDKHRAEKHEKKTKKLSTVK